MKDNQGILGYTGCQKRMPRFFLERQMALYRKQGLGLITGVIRYIELSIYKMGE